MEGVLGHWRDKHHPVARRGRLAVVTGPMGSGKTIMSCVLQRQLAMTWKKKVAFWISGSQLADSPKDDQLLHRLTGLADPRQELSCFILDGLDEHVRPWDGLGRLFQELVDSNIPTVVTVNDTYLGPQLERILGPHWPPMNWRHFKIQPWRDSDLLRATLRAYMLDRVSEEYWHEYCKRNGYENPERACNALAESVPTGTLESPLLFGLTVDILFDRLTGQQHPEDSLASATALTNEWITRCLLREQWPKLPPSTPDQRRQAARRLAFYLALSGLGTSGVSIGELDGKELAWIWEPLEPSDPSSHLPTPGYEQVVKNEAFRERVNELASGCLIQARTSPKGLSQHRLAPFHSHLLVHLAAEFIERFSTGAEDIASYTETAGAGATAIDFLHAAAGQTAQQRLHTLGVMIDHHLGDQALAYDSLLSKAVAYRSVHPGRQISPVPAIEPTKHYFRFAGLHAKVSTDPLFEFDALSRQKLGALTLLSETGATTSAQSDAPRRIRGIPCRPLPPGSYLVWSEEETSGKPKPVCAYHGCLMAESVVTIEEFAHFLNENPDEDTGPNLHRDPATRKVTAPQDITGEPMRGTSVDQAQRYCEWLQGTLQTDDEFRGHDIHVRLPTLTDFQIAVAGTGLCQPRPYAQGPFGHLDLVSEVQHVVGEDDRCESFGWPLAHADRNRTMRDKLNSILVRYPHLVDMHKSLPELDSQIALRIVVELGTAPVEKKGKRLALAGAAAPPPGGNPPADSPGSPGVAVEYELESIARRVAALTAEYMKKVHDVVAQEYAEMLPESPPRPSGHRSTVRREYALMLPEDAYEAWLHILVHVAYRDRRRTAELIRKVAAELPEEKTQLLCCLADSIEHPAAETRNGGGDS